MRQLIIIFSFLAGAFFTPIVHSETEAWLNVSDSTWHNNINNACIDHAANMDGWSCDELSDPYVENPYYYVARTIDEVETRIFYATQFRLLCEGTTDSYNFNTQTCQSIDYCSDKLGDEVTHSVSMSTLLDSSSSLNDSLSSTINSSDGCSLTYGGIDSCYEVVSGGSSEFPDGESYCNFTYTYDGNDETGEGAYQTSPSGSPTTNEATTFSDNAITTLDESIERTPENCVTVDDVTSCVTETITTSYDLPGHEIELDGTGTLELSEINERGELVTTTVTASTDNITGEITTTTTTTTVTNTGETVITTFNETNNINSSIIPSESTTATESTTIITNSTGDILAETSTSTSTESKPDPTVCDPSRQVCTSSIDETGTPTGSDDMFDSLITVTGIDSLIANIETETSYSDFEDHYTQHPIIPVYYNAQNCLTIPLSFMGFSTVFPTSSQCAKLQKAKEFMKWFLYILTFFFLVRIATK